MFIKTIILFAVLSVAMPTDAYAYLDPGTGSMVIQMAIGAIAAGLLAMRVYWHKIKTFFIGLKKPCKKKD